MKRRIEMGVLEEILAKVEQLEGKVQQLLAEQEKASMGIIHPMDKILDIEGACNRTGYSKSSLYHHARQRTIPHYKHEGKLMFKASELDKWMLGHRIMTKEEINNRATRYVTAHTNK